MEVVRRDGDLVQVILGLLSLPQPEESEDKRRQHRQEELHDARQGNEVDQRQSFTPELERQLAWRRQLHKRDLRDGLARAALPEALARKYPRVAEELRWQFLFASRQRSRDPKTGDTGRHHVDPGSLARAVCTAEVEAAVLATRGLAGKG
jgi:hypothetical protein